MDSALAHDLENTEQRTSDVAAGPISFEELNLNPNILKCLQSHKFSTPTKIQAAAIPMAIAGIDLLVQSKSGTGKTLIYVLAACQNMDRSVGSPQTLVIVPTRELAIQVEDTVNSLASHMRYKSAYLGVSFIGGTDVKKDRIRIARGRIVIGTPGRLLHLIQNNVFNTSDIKLLVLDEADQLYCTDSLQKDVQKLVASLRSGTQIIACSATYPDGLDERLAKLMHKPVLVSNSERATVLLGVRQFVYELPKQLNSMQEMQAKLAVLQQIFAQVSYEQAILFASSQSRADSFRNLLQRLGVECELMSGAMKQSDRLETFQAYRNFKMRVVVSTDLMARGVDSSHANLVINLDPPDELVTYLHRIGRAGRFGSKGIAITFISSPQQSQQFKRIIADAGTGMSVLQFPSSPREGFNFWDYSAYDFPYFYKTEAREQEDEDLNRIKQTAKDSDSKPREESGSSKEEVDEAKKDEPTNHVLHQKEPNVVTIIETRSDPLVVESKENIASNSPSTRKLNKHKQRGERGLKSTQPPELPIELAELTPSTEVPAAAPNSINTKTYCLVAPTEASSTTLHPQGISNTVDDASSIISDSMENDYDSDASYNSCFSESDVKVIWQHVQSQRKLRKRRGRNAGRHIYLYQRRRDARNTKNKAQKVKIETSKDWFGKRNKLFPRQLNIECSDQWHSDQVNRLLELISWEQKLLHLLNKCDNSPKLKDSLMRFVKRGSSGNQLAGKWIDLLYDSLVHLYYVDHSKLKRIKKPAVPGSANLRSYNRLMDVIKGRASCSHQPLSKLTVHINQQLNIPPIEAAAEINAADSDSDSSYVPPAGEDDPINDLSENDSMDVDSLEPLSSSGFVESGESASSGIDTSQYDTNSSVELDSDDYEEEGEEEEDEDYELNSNVSQVGSSSVSTLSEGSDDDSTETDPETDSESDDVDADQYEREARDALALAQSRWQYLFQMQYQFIADYVGNYMATYRNQN